MSDEKKIVPVDNHPSTVGTTEGHTSEGQSNDGIRETASGNANETTERYTKDSSRGKFASWIVAVLALLLVFALLFAGYRYATTGTATYSSTPAEQVMAEKNSPDLKANKLDTNRVYNLKETKDSFNGMTITITKAQFRKDSTRLWVKMDNDSGKKVHMMPNVNASLTDNNGHTYKVDSFSGDSVTFIAPDAHEEIMLVFDPIRADASSVTFNLDSVFDMKNSAWTYSIAFDLP